MKLNYDLKKGMSVEVKNTSISVFDSNGNEIYYEDGDNYWIKYGYDSKGNEIYWENSKGYWSKKEYDCKGNRVYFEDCNGKIIDNRPKTKLTKEEYTFIKHFKRVECIIKGDGYLHFYEGDWVRFNVFKLDDLDLKFDSLEQEIEYKADELEVE